MVLVKRIQTLAEFYKTISITISLKKKKKDLACKDGREGSALTRLELTSGETRVMRR